MFAELVKLEELEINIDHLKKHVYKYIQPRKKFYKERCRNLYLESDFSEWWVEKSTSGIHIGNGNYPIDVISCTQQGIDVLSVCISGNISNEKSIIQIFKGDSGNLDNLFKSENYNKVVELFKDTLANKLSKCKEEQELENIYYVSFISTKTDIYCLALKLNINNIGNIKPKLSKYSKTSIVLENVIDSKHGNSKIYKSKKRMELRFNKAILSDAKVLKIFSLDDSVSKQSDARPV